LERGEGIVYGPTGMEVVWKWYGSGMDNTSDTRMFRKRKREKERERERERKREWLDPHMRS
jgi:hypothetical protein